MEVWIGNTRLRMSRIDMWIVPPRLGMIWYEDLVGYWYGKKVRYH